MQCWQDCAQAVPIFTLVLHAHHPALVPPYPDYFTIIIIKEPIALSSSILHKRAISVSYYKTVLQFRNDYRLMFNNARKYYTNH
jgi:hypothetical protein